MADNISFVENNKGEFAVPCQIKLSEDCVRAGEFCESPEEAREWVEDDCWIFSGEGFICHRCNEQIYINIGRIRNKNSN